VADTAGGVRSSARFLPLTGRTSIELGDSIISPVHHKYERPRRGRRPAAAPSGRHILTVGPSRPSDPLDDEHLRLGTGEGIRLLFQDIGWEATTITPCGRRLASPSCFPCRLRSSGARPLFAEWPTPRHATKHLFVAMKTPFGPLNASGPLRHIIAKHAKAAGSEIVRTGQQIRHCVIAWSVNNSMIFDHLTCVRRPPGTTREARLGTDLKSGSFGSLG
jgi:integrase/recombinase XerD